jgi:tetratricopeptide (TPR) repeat protein
MIDKKKSAAQNIERRMKPQAPKPVKPSSPVRSAASEPAHASPAVREAAAAKTQPVTQRGSFEAAMKLFHARKMREARELFVRASQGPERDVAQRAQIHMAMCDRRLEQPPMTLSSGEDYYNYGVALINTHKAAEARVQLEKALEISPGAEHIHYALALAQALSGDPINAYANLKRAIELEPRNRLIARQDTDFAPLANQPPFDSLLFPERNAWSDRNSWSDGNTAWPDKNPWPGKKAW